MIVYLRIDGFYVQGLTHAVVVRNRTVLDLTQSARSLGIEAGMPLGVAKALLGKSDRPAQILKWEPDRYEEAQRQWLDACVAYSDVIEPVDQHEGYVDLSAHPEPDSVLDSMLKSIPGTVRCGVAKAKWLAKVALEIGDPERLAYYAPNAFLDELPTARLEPVLPESRARLEFLGYRWSSDVARVPLETLKAQFGKEGLTIWQACRGRAGETVLALYPEASLADRLYFESPVETLEPIHLAIGEMATRLSKKLQARDLQGSILRLWVGYEDGSEELREREFAKPMQSDASIRFAALILDKFERPVSGLRMQLPELRRANRKQQNLYVARSEPKEVIESAVGQVQRVFGSEAIRRGSDIKLPRRQLVLRAWKDATGWA